MKDKDGNQPNLISSPGDGRDPSNQSSRHARIKQRMVQKYQDDFEKLKGLYSDALIAQSFCTDAVIVLAIFDCLKTFLHRQGLWDDAIQSAQRAIEAAHRIGNTKQEAEANLQCGLIADETAEFDLARSYYQAALVLAQSVDALSIQAEATRRLGWGAQVAGEVDTAVAYYEEALALYGQDNHALGQVRTYKHIAMLELEQSQFDHANITLAKADEIHLVGEELRESNRLRAWLKIEMGRIFGRKGEKDKAGAHYETALSLAKQAEDESLCKNILFLRTQLFEKELSFAEVETAYKDYRDFAIALGDKRAQTAAYLALGNLYFQRSKPEDALYFYDQASTYADLNQRAIILARKGNIALKQKDFTVANGFYQKALARFQALDAWKEMAGCYQQLGIVAQYNNHMQTAIDYYQTSLDIRREHGLEYDAIQSLYQLGILFHYLGQTVKACVYYLEASELAKRFDFPQSSMIQARIDELNCGS